MNKTEKKKELFIHEVKDKYNESLDQHNTVEVEGCNLSASDCLYHCEPEVWQAGLEEFAEKLEKEGFTLLPY